MTEPHLAPLTAWSAPQVMCPRLIKYLAAFCMLNCFYAATLPSAPAPKFEADKITVLFATLLPPSALSFDPCPVPVATRSLSPARSLRSGRH